MKSEPNFASESGPAAPGPSASGPAAAADTSLLMQSMAELLAQAPGAGRASLSLSPRVQAHLEWLLKFSPQLFAGIANELGNILEDGKIDMKDLPHCVSLVHKVLSLNIKDILSRRAMTKSEFLEIIRVILHSVLLSDKSPVKVKADPALVVQLIDTSILLLSIEQIFPQSWWDSAVRVSRRFARALFSCSCRNADDDTLN